MKKFHFFAVALFHRVRGLKLLRIKDKIKALINLSGKSQVSIAPEFGMSKESFNNKLRGAMFSISDLIKLADITDTQIAFIDKAGKPLITFDVEDIKKN